MQDEFYSILKASKGLLNKETRLGSERVVGPGIIRKLLQTIVDRAQVQPNSSSIESSSTLRQESKGTESVICYSVLG